MEGDACPASIAPTRASSQRSTLSDTTSVGGYVCNARSGSSSELSSLEALPCVTTRQPTAVPAVVAMAPLATLATTHGHALAIIPADAQQPRLCVACEACHDRKLKCKMPEDGGRCDACEQKDRECIARVGRKRGRPRLMRPYTQGEFVLAYGAGCAPSNGCFIPMPAAYGSAAGLPSASGCMPPPACQAPQMVSMQPVACPVGAAVPYGSFATAPVVGVGGADAARAQPSLVMAQPFNDSNVSYSQAVAPTSVAVVAEKVPVQQPAAAGAASPYHGPCHPPTQYPPPLPIPYHSQPQLPAPPPQQRPPPQQPLQQQPLQQQPHAHQPPPPTGAPMQPRTSHAVPHTTTATCVSTVPTAHGHHPVAHLADNAIAPQPSQVWPSQAKPPHSQAEGTMPPRLAAPADAEPPVPSRPAVSEADLLHRADAETREAVQALLGAGSQLLHDSHQLP